MSEHGLVRGETDEIVFTVKVTNEDDLRLALSLHDGVNAKKQLRDLAKIRYGTTVESKRRDDGTIEYVVVSDGTDAAIDANRYEAFPTDMCRRLVKSKASLFTSDNQVWSVTIPGDEAITEETDEEIEGETVGEQEPTASEVAQETWQEYREKGQATLKLIRADRLSVLMRVAGIYMTWRSDRIAYDVLAPYNMYFGFAELIDDNDQTRPTHPTEIEECTAFVVENIRIQGNDDDVKYTQERHATDRTKNKQRTYTAWVGRTKNFPEGRLVTYDAETPMDIPEPSDPEKRIKYEDPLGNPLTKWANEHPDNIRLEFPITLFLGTDAGEAEVLLPTEGLGLAETCVEVDLFVSRAMTAILDSAIGLQKNTTDHEVSQPNPYPNVTCGKWWGHRGQDVDFVSNGSEHALNALEFMNKLIQFKAENNDVPGYLVTPDSTSAPESGIALAIRTMPMHDDRQERETQAQGAVQRMFEIEKRLIDIYADDDKKIPIDAELSWSAGQLELPESETERIANIKALEDNGYIDHVEGVRRANKLNTRTEAKAMIDDQELDEPTGPPNALDGLGLAGLEEEVEQI
jgi:hypothetical protein